jgi:hypothetical protein
MNALTFRVWCKNFKEWERDNVLIDKYGNIYHIGETGMRLVSPESHVVQRGTGMKDINGVEIFEGDVLVVYPENRRKTQLDSDIFEIRSDLPRKPLQDIVIDKGVVTYSPPAFRLKYETPNENGAVSASLFDGDNYEIIGNIFQN